MQTPDHQHFNLLEIKPIRALILWRGFPYIFQVLLLLVFIALIVLSWNDFAPQSVNDKLYAKTHLVNLTVWGGMVAIDGMAGGIVRLHMVYCLPA